MTIDEAIEAINYSRAFNEKNTPLMQAWDVIIGYVNSARNAECEGCKNEPLTLDELSKMGFEDWVWIDFPEETKEKSKWERAALAYRVNPKYKYGSSWVAYPKQRAR